MRALLAGFLVVLALSQTAPLAPRMPAALEQREWTAYGGGSESIRYSSLKQIHRTNVHRLEVAWTFDAADGPGGLQTQPIIVEGVLYANTPKHRVIALDAATGALRWKFDSGLEATGANRGVTWWAGDDDGEDLRIFAGIDRYVYALDARTGRPISTFGRDGRIDLHEGLGRDPAAQSVRLTTPGIVYKDLLIVGGRVAESLPASPGDVRAYDARTGALRWAFHTIPHPGEPGYETWPKDAWTYSGGANNWAGMSLDERRGIVFVPTGSAAADFYGANRAGDNLFANSLLALEAATGKRIWHFQAVRHDIWDRDFPAPPSLVTVTRNGRSIDAVAQTTKQGHVFLFDRTTGKPLFPIRYRKYARSPVDGEVTAETQPLPARPAPYARQALTERLLTTRTPDAHRAVLTDFRRMRSGGQFLPLSLGTETVIFPGFDGGAEWGGAAFDPERGWLFVNSNEMPWRASLAPAGKADSGRAVYLRDCAVCHRDNMRGTPPEFPSLVGIGKRRSDAELTAVIRKGTARMPGFPALSDEAVRALIRYMTRGEDRQLAQVATSPIDLKYRFTGYNRFLDPDGYPAVVPPWGTLNAIDLNTGEYAWRVPLGEYPELAAKGMKNTGSENYGGPIVTAGGLVFIGATSFDRKFRAFDRDTGALLWDTTLPFAGNATPATYEAGGRQFVVIAAGGGKAPKAASGGTYVAFAIRGSNGFEPVYLGGIAANVFSMSASTASVASTPACKYCSPSSRVACVASPHVPERVAQ
jgi:quinoprotein glucose dehydrogenase